MFVNAKHEQALASWHTGKKEEALTLIREALVEEPEQPSLLVEEGFILLDTGKKEDAIIVFQKICDLQPENAYRYTCLGYAYQFAGKYKQALAAYNQSIEMDFLDAIARYNSSLIPGNPEAEKQLFIAKALFEEIDYVTGKMLSGKQPLNPLIVIREQQKAMLKFKELTKDGGKQLGEVLKQSGKNQIK